jgi:hypothetical protein
MAEPKKYDRDAFNAEILGALLGGASEPKSPQGKLADHMKKSKFFKRIYVNKQPSGTSQEGLFKGSRIYLSGEK